MFAVWTWPSCLLCGDDARKWPVEIVAGPFEIHADFEIESPERLVRELHAVSRDVRQKLEIIPQPTKIHIVLFQSDAEYRRYMHNYFPNIPPRRAIFIQDRGPGMLFTHWHSQVAADLRHEVSHALINTGNTQLPLWLDEGLAEYFENSPENRQHGGVYHRAIRTMVQQGSLPELRLLESITKFESFSAEHYRDSWAWVHFLLHHSPDTHRLLVRYVEQVQAGEQPLALSRQLAHQFPNPAQELATHFAGTPVTRILR